jgi:hypothetical protein
MAAGRAFRFGALAFLLWLLLLLLLLPLARADDDLALITQAKQRGKIM